MVVCSIILIGNALHAQTIIQSIPLPASTFWVSAYGLAADTGSLMITSSTSNVSYFLGKIYKLDHTGKLIDSVSTGQGSSQGLAYDGANFYYVKRYTAFCTVIKMTGTGTIIDSMRFSSPSRYIGGATWDGSSLWISQYYPNPGKLYKINWTAKTIVDSIQTIGDQPEGVAWDGHYLYYAMDIFSSETNLNLIYVVDPVTHDTVRTIPMPEGYTVDSNPTGLAWDGQHLWLIARPVGGGSTKVLYEYDLGGGGTPSINVPEKFFDFGWVSLGDSSVMTAQIQNVGTDTLTVDSVSIRYSSSFTFGLSTPSLLPPGATTNVPIVFRPPAYGPDSAHIVLYHNDITHGPQEIRVTGSGKFPPPTIAVPSVHDFGVRRTGSTNSWQLVIENHGALPLVVGSTSLGTSDFYTEGGTFPLTVDPVSSRVVRLWFRPASGGHVLDSLRIFSNADNFPEAVIALSGEGDPASIPIAMPLWSFVVPDHPVSNSFRTVKAVRTISDITGDGKPDAIISTENYWTVAVNGNSSVDNDTLWAFNTYVSSYSAGSIGTAGDYSYQKALAIASDLNNDSYNDVVIGTGGGNEHVYAINGKTGRMLWTYGTDDPDSFGLGDFTGVSVGEDFTGDGIPDVLAAASATQSGGVGGRRTLYLFNGSNGSLLWQSFLGGFTHAVASVPDVNGDAIPDAVATIGEPVYAVKMCSGSNGGELWSHAFDPATGGAKELLVFPVPGDVPDIIVSAFWGPVVRLNGRKDSVVWTHDTGGLPNGDVTQMALLRDVTGDGVDEVLVSLLGNGTQCLNGRTGEIVWSLPTGNTMGIASISDLDGDGIDEAVIASQVQGTIIARGDHGGTLGSYTFGPGIQTREVCVLPDVDRNYSPEILVGSDEGTVAVLSGGVNAPAPQVSDTISFGARWNLVSIPFMRDDNSVSSIYPAALTGTTFRFHGGYFPSDTLTPGNGYWTKFPSAVDQFVSGIAMPEVEVHLDSGWNLVGSVDHECAPPSFGFMRSPWYSYENGYDPTAVMRPGKGYWIKSAMDTSFVLGGSTSKQALPMPFQSLNRIRLTDCRGRSQTLYFGINPSQSRPHLEFEMPPPSPDNYDVRFASGASAIMEREDDQDKFEYAILLRNALPPIVVEYTISTTEVRHIALATVDHKEIQKTSLSGTGRAVFQSHSGMLMLSATDIATRPASYTLSQNYPNPFNPSTVIRYQLPSPSYVILAVYNNLGQQVAVLAHEVQSAGYRSVEYDGSGLASGVYFYRLTATSLENAGKTYSRVRKMVLLR